jgi:uncharacterized repeat protein (TIGR02543 family)
MKKIILKNLAILCVYALVLFFIGNSVTMVSADSASTYYVSTETGLDSNPGTLDKPFRTIGKAATVVAPGDTVYIRGGIYYEQVTLSVSGVSNKPITWEGYKNETVVINGINRSVVEADPIDGTTPQLYLKSCDWQILRKLTIINSPQYGISDYTTPSNNNIYDRIKTSDNYGIGFRICGDYNQLIDCESSYNFDYAGEWGLLPGEDSDGFSPDGKYNTFKRCISFHNSDDGYDCWTSQYTLFEDCIAYENGTSDGCRNRDKGNWEATYGLFSGDGNGFKLGKGPNYQAFNTTLRCIAYNNLAAGISTNEGGGNSILNCTAYNNGWNDIAWWDNVNNIGEKTTILKNNIAFEIKHNEATTIMNTNSWELGLIPEFDPNDFVSIDPQSSNFLKLSVNSRFIDKGTNIGYSYFGDFPDLGAYEYQGIESPVTYVVTYDGNGATSGTVPTDSNTYLSGANVPLKGNTGNLTKTGYTFGGWSLTPNETAITTYTMGTTPVTFYAVWNPVLTYKVTYDGNGATSGTVPTDSNTYLSGANVPLKGNTGNLAKTGYTFGGWSLAPNGAALTSYTMGTSDVTFYAVWSLSSNQGGNTQPVISNNSGSNGGSVNMPTRTPFLENTNGSGSIVNQLKKAKAGDAVVINMNSTTTLKSEWIEAIAGKDIDMVLDMGNGIKWTINGKIITGKNFSDVDLAVKTGTNKIPVSVINNLTGEKNVMQFTITHSGEFGFTAKLSINLGKDNTGLYANLFYYNETTKALEFISVCKIGANGSAAWDLAHASTYAVIIDKASLAPEDVSTGIGANVNKTIVS